MLKKIRDLLHREKGQGLVEYGLILALISVLSIGVVSSVGGGVKGQFDTIGNAISPTITEPTAEGFVWVANNSSSSYEATNETGRGYYKYAGKDKVVEVPHEINGHPMTRYTHMFEGSGVEKVVSTNPNITDMRYMFSNATSPTIDLSEFDTGQVRYMDWMFANSNFKSLDLSAFDTRSAVRFGYMFYKSKATNIDISSFETPNVTYLGAMFYESAITSVDVTHFDTRNVNDTTNMFDSTVIEYLDVSNFNLSGVTKTSAMVRNTVIQSGHASSQRDVDILHRDMGNPQGGIFTVKERN